MSRLWVGAWVPLGSLLPVEAQACRLVAEELNMPLALVLRDKALQVALAMPSTPMRPVAVAVRVAQVWQEPKPTPRIQVREVAMVVWA